ncbi:MAG: hypothetical protein ACHQ50_14675 [Fimbriimonadales bacterium]
MRLSVGVTDKDWFDQIQELRPDEVNFWKPARPGSPPKLAPLL